MGKRSQARTRWPKWHDAPTAHTVRVWICAGCRDRCQLIACADGKQRCPGCKAKFDRRQTEEQESVLAAAKHTPGPILPAGQVVRPPRVG